MVIHWTLLQLTLLQVFATVVPLGFTSASLGTGFSPKVASSKNQKAASKSSCSFYLFVVPLKIEPRTTRPEQLWVSDITYIKTEDGHNYLALITDAYSKQIMGYKLDNHMRTSLCTDALDMAIKNR